MRRALLTSILAACALGACDSVPVDDQRADGRVYPARGVIRGAVTYEGAAPCSKDGHVVGSAVVFVFDRANPPPPAGFAAAAVNFASVPGDVLFPDEPRNPGPDLYCPKDHGDSRTLSTTAPFAIAPLDAGSYIVLAFYDRNGEFFPTFASRNLPEKDDIVGGYIDTADAVRHVGDANYRPIFLPVDVAPGGNVVDGVVVTLAVTLPFPRPYFHPDAPVTMTQDHAVLAPPRVLAPAGVQALEASFASLRLNWGIGSEEAAVATDPNGVLKLPIPPSPPGGLVVWSAGTNIPETAGLQLQVPQMWPQIALVKLDEDASVDGLVVQGSASKPIVLIQAITLWNDSLLASATSPPSTSPGADNVKDHVRALVRPSVLCVDPRHVAQGGLLVAPHLTGKAADDPTGPDEPLVDPDALLQAEGGLVREIRRGCLPTGTYGVSTVYPTGQAWTVPNELGACAPSEGTWNKSANPSSCTAKPRPVLASQGMRAVLRIVEPTSDEGRALCADAPVPAECVANP